MAKINSLRVGDIREGARFRLGANEVLIGEPYAGKVMVEFKSGDATYSDAVSASELVEMLNRKGYRKAGASIASLKRANVRRRKAKRSKAGRRHRTCRARAKLHRRLSRRRRTMSLPKTTRRQFSHPSIKYFRQDGYNDGRYNADIHMSDHKGSTPDQIAKSARGEMMAYGLRGSGTTQAALEHAEGSKSKARGLLRAYLDAFEVGIKDNIEADEAQRAADRQMGYED